MKNYFALFIALPYVYGVAGALIKLSLGQTLGQTVAPDRAEDGAAQVWLRM